VQGDVSKRHKLITAVVDFPINIFFFFVLFAAGASPAPLRSSLWMYVKSVCNPFLSILLIVAIISVMAGTFCSSVGGDPDDVILMLTQRRLFHACDDAC